MPIQKTQSKRELIRIGKHLSEVIHVKDAAGNLLQKIVKPVMIEIYPRDIIQLIVGATLLAVPVSYTQEVWDLGTTISDRNAAIVSLLSLSFVGLFIYYNFYRNHFSSHWFGFIKRVLSTYIIALCICWLFLFLIDKAPGGDDWVITVKRMVLIGLPSTMSAAVADMLK